MAAALPVLVNRDLNRAKNKKAADEVIPFVYETVIAWGCSKNKDESFLKYYNRRPEKFKKLWEDHKEEWEKEVEEKLITRDMSKWPEANKEKEKKKIAQQLKEERLKEFLIKESWTQEDKQHLAQKTCEGLDATFLHKLVPTICYGIGRYDPNAPSSTKIEQFLREVKNIRNDICHDPKGASISDAILDDLEVSAVNVFKAAGRLYAPALDQQTMQGKIDELKEMLRTLKTEVMTDEQQRILQTAKKMSEDGMTEMMKVVQEQAIDFLPFSDDKFTRTDVFHAVTVTIREEKQSKYAKSPEDQTIVEIPCTELLEHHDGKILLCEGVPGSGKTTFLRRLREDFFAKGEKKFRGLDMFDLLLYMDCRDLSLDNILDLLKRTFPRTMNQLKDQEVLQALHNLELLICVDGLDELNRKSRKLLDELIRTFKMNGNATFVCTSRPGQSHHLRSVKFKTVSLQPVTNEEEQIAFLERYQANIDGIEAPELIGAFKTIDQSCKDCLRQPIYLALFCFLFRKYGQEVCTWRNELAIMEYILLLSQETMIDRMREMDVDNLEGYAADVTAAITRLSVQLLSRDELKIEVKTITEICRNIFGKADVRYYSLMSSFFTRHPDGQSYDVFHKSYLEFLAAKCLFNALESNPSASIKTAILAHVQNRQSNLSDTGASYSEAAMQRITADRQTRAARDGAAPSPSITEKGDDSLKRLVNVLRFVCMLIHEGGQPMEGALKSFLAEVCPALANEKVGFDYWTDLVLGCPDSVQVARAAAQAAHTVKGEGWEVQSSRAMTATSQMLPHRQPTTLDINPLRGLEDDAALAVLLEAVTRWHTGVLRLTLNESHDNYSACDASLACLESARCELNYFKGCLSGVSCAAWRALRRCVESARTRQGGSSVLGGSRLYISLLDPKSHELGQLDGTYHALYIRVRLPSSPGHRRRQPLPTSWWRHPDLRVECRPAAGGGAPGDKGATAALIEVLAPRDMKYDDLYLLHYPGPDGALDGMVATLRARGVRARGSSTLGWEELSNSRDGHCDACGDKSSSHRTGERCVRLYL